MSPVLLFDNWILSYGFLLTLMLFKQNWLRYAENLSRSECSANNRKKSEEHQKHDCRVENKALYTATGFKDRPGATSTEGASQTSTTHLKQNKDDYGRAQNDLYHANSRQPLLKVQEYSSLSY